MKFVAVPSLLSIWLVSMVMSTCAQPAVLDTDGQPLQSDVEYYVLPGITDVAGGLTLVDRINDCPLYVGQEPIASVVSQGFPVKFKPFADGETIIREARDLTVTFQAFTTCIQSLAWRVAETNPETGRRYIATAGEADYFRIEKFNDGGDYKFVRCPSESCPNCGRPRCGSAGIVVENNKSLLLFCQTCYFCN